MWIRTQDKLRLLKIKDARIGYNKDCCDIWANNICILGTYSTKEKALKVLDKIQNAIIRNETIYAHEYSGSGVRDYDVFQMPQDDEVK